VTTVRAEDIRGVLVSVACDACGGAGKTEGTKGRVYPCEACNGAGNVGKTVTFQVFAQLLAKVPFTVKPPTMERETVQHIIGTVARYFGLLTDDVVGTSRHKTVVTARAIAMRFAKERLELSLPELGAAFGHRDHTTCLMSLRRVEERRKRGDEVVVLALQDLYNTFNPKSVVEEAKKLMEERHKESI